ncbi:hypothetical protein [Rahnella aceris]|uniref:hypothetical protein n=1 Tax=Rahnella sp. (strain Y9602) TaxID=2703885 RepID=UPI003FD4030D
MKPQTQKLIITVARQQVINIVVFALAVFISFNVYNKVEFNDVKDVLNTLLGLSASIFTIVGLWVGFLYPNAINSIVNDDISYIKNEQDSPRIEKLINVIIISALVMLGILLAYLARLILPIFDIYKENLAVFKVTSLSILVMMCWLQSKCIFSIIISNYHFVNNLHGKITTAKLEHPEK